MKSSYTTWQLKMAKMTPLLCLVNTDEIMLYWGHSMKNKHGP
jgi:hypothetical protein